MAKIARPPLINIDKLPASRVPIWLQLSIATMIVLAVSITVLSYIILQRQRENLYDHTVKLGMVSLDYVAENAKVPLLTGDTLALNTLVNNVASVDGHFYSFIVNNDNIVKAHTNHEKIDKPFEPFKNVEKEVRRGEVVCSDYTLNGTTPVLNLKKTVLFQDKKLGEVHVGISTDFIRHLFIDERAFLFWSTLIIIMLGMTAAVLFSLRFSKPLSQLVTATSQIAKGNYDYKVNLKRNDELGTLGEAFNRMGTELFRQSMMRESFGKYVGREVVEMITKTPGQSWLKGRKSKATILFADIRGFTAYAETKEPEAVVEKLNEFFAIVTEVILAHGGYIDKFIGDSVLAVFGLPVAQEDHQEKCIRAAVAIQQKLAKTPENGNPLLKSIGIGIASGVVVAGNIGSQVKMEYTVIGDSVNIASYLNTLANAGEIIVAETTDSDPVTFIEKKQLEPQKIKGREGLVNVYQVIRLKEQ